MELSELRTEIDAVDEELLQLFLRRMRLSEGVADYKLAHGLPLLNRQREREILADMAEKSGDLERYSYQLFTTLFSLSRAHQSQRMNAPTKSSAWVRQALSEARTLFPQTGRIACPGTEGGNAQAAADRLFPRGNLIYLSSFAAAADAVESGLCDFAVLPIENSANGSVRAVYALLQQRELSIVRSCRLCIRHELLAPAGATLDGLTRIYSHPQALGQCSHFLSTLKNVELIPCSNTALAAKAVAESGDIHQAAIASHPCAELYGLSCLSDTIQDSENNYTRFICVSPRAEIYTGANRMSLILGLPNRPGALHEVLSKLAALGVNLSKLESCPVSGRSFEFIFFLELEADAADPAVLALLEELERSAESFHLLGCYSEV